MKKKSAMYIYNLICEMSEPKNDIKPFWEEETWTEKTARLPFEQLVWSFCEPDKQLANEVLEIAKKKSEQAWNRTRFQG